MNSEDRTLSLMTRPVLALALLVALVGCAAPAPAPVATVTATTTATAIADPAEPSPTATPTAEKDADGNALKKVGEMAAAVGEDGVTYVKFRVNRIEPFKCNWSGADKAKNGHYVGVWMEFWTDKAVGGDNVPAVETDAWQVIGADGVTENDSDGNSDFCANDATALPYTIEGAKHVKGVVVLDIKAKHGGLVFTFSDAATGWRYNF
jgi:hypothetical protein